MAVEEVAYSAAELAAGPVPVDARKVVVAQTAHSAKELDKPQLVGRANLVAQQFLYQMRCLCAPRDEADEARYEAFALGVVRHHLWKEEGYFNGRDASPLVHKYHAVMQARGKAAKQTTKKGK